MADARGDWSAQVRLAWQISPFAVELSALAEDEIDGLRRYLESRPSLPFRYLSIHGPSKGKMMSEEALVEILVELSPFAAGIVMHPDTIEDPVPYRALGRKLLLENMDARKSDGRTAEELIRWLESCQRRGSAST